jgi:hypothetical protein
VQEGIASTISDLTDVIKSDLPVNEKFGKLGSTVQNHVTPVLETAQRLFQDAIRSADSAVRGDAAGEDGIPQSAEKKSNGDSR